jgi:predicted AAA+ superfamily ATPase
VLNELHAQLQTRRIGYWRDKRGHEIDFVLTRRGQEPLALECKWSAKDVDLVNLKAFAHLYPKADLRVIAYDIDKTIRRRSDSLTITYCSLNTLLESLSKKSSFLPE